jgi:phenylalanyl-tRNA synthetase alpha chain
MHDEMTPEQAAVLNGLESGRAERVPDLAQRLGLDQSQVAAAALQLSQRGFCALHEEPFREWLLKEAGREALAAGLPERGVLRALLAHEGRGSLVQAAEWTGLSAREIGQSIRGLQQRGWAVKTGADLVATDGGRIAVEVPEPDETVLVALVAAASGRLTEDELISRGCETIRARELFGVRSALIEIRDRVHRSVVLLAAGEQLRAAGVTARPLVTELTPEMLASGQWREVRFKPYDVDLATEPRYPGKRHPLQLVIEQTRSAFFNLGFEEWNSPLVESSFWDFDALFQPQDHPAREAQDTFYVARPARSPLPADAALVDRVRAVHEDGGDTGSAGWQYRWSPELAQRNILRTHNTATTIRALAEIKRGPRKVFSVGRVFRREAIDYKHLPVFFQVDGIVIDADGSLASLFGTMGAFLEQLGFTKYDFRPDFFPYTEPSVGVFIWNEERRDWFELAGAGIFRPEVTEPLGCTEPVLAWGFGLDRLAMAIGGVKDIRDLYLVDLEWLKGVPQCR